MKKVWSNLTAYLIIAVLSLSILGMASQNNIGTRIQSISLYASGSTLERYVFGDGAEVGIIAQKESGTGGTDTARITDTMGSEIIYVTLNDDGAGDDDTAADGIYSGNFTISNDRGTNGAFTDNSTGVIDLGDGDGFKVEIDLNGDGIKENTAGSADFSAPIVEMHTPDNQFYNSSFTLNFTVSDENLDLDNVGYRLDNGPLVKLQPVNITRLSGRGGFTSYSYLADIDCTNDTEGKHTVDVEAQDMAWNINPPVQVDINVDHTAP